MKSIKHYKRVIFYLSCILFLLPKHSSAGELKSEIGATVLESSGNIDAINIAIDGELSYNQKRSAQSLEAGIKYAETNKEKTANSSYIELKNRNNITDKAVYFFESCKVEGDEFVGYRYRLSFNGGLGFKHKVEIGEMTLEAGPGFIYESTDEANQGYPSVRGFLKYLQEINKHANWSTYLKHIRDIKNINNYHVKWCVEMTVQLTEGLSLKSNREFNYNHMPPKGAKKHDWITGFSLVMSF